MEALVADDIKAALALVNGGVKKVVEGPHLTDRDNLTALESGL